MKDKRNSRNLLKNQIHSVLAFILFLHCIFYLIYWFSIGNLKDEVDLFIANQIGLSLLYTLILILLTAGIGIWSLIRFVSMQLAIRKGAWHPSFFNWIYFGIWITFLFLFYFSFLLILRENPSQKGVIYQLVNLIRLGADPLLFLISAIWLRRLILGLRKRAVQSKNRWLRGIGIGILLLLLVGIWLLPAIFPPNWAYQGNLPAKPALLAHRGASMLAPENTLAAAELAVEYGAFGFETDIRISLDGIPFLMHDETLQRTTNVAEVYPDRAIDDASSFTMDELRALNAGLWFIQKDPYNTIESGLVSQSQLSVNQGQKIPTLVQALELVSKEDMVILFDLRYPPPEHPYHDQFFEIVFDLCKESGQNGDIWFLVDRENLDLILEEAPQMTRVIGASSTNLPDPGILINLNYEILNVDAGILKDEILAYREEGLGVNVYTIDQPWLFSQFWLSGVTSITTNNIHTLSRLETPFLNLSYSSYLIFWGLFGIIVAIWIASSQPKFRMERTEPQKVEMPDLLDFAMEEDSKKEILAENGEDLEKDSTKTDEITSNNGSDLNPVDNKEDNE